jgi:hypothetical protein
MKQALLILLVIISSSLSTYACECFRVTFAQEISRSDHIFIGTAIERTITNKAHYLFEISKTFKGSKVDTVLINTGLGGPDCEIEFEIGKTYIVYLRDNETNRCSRSAPLKNNPDTGKIKYVFETGFSKEAGRTTNPLLTDNEAEYFNYELLAQRNNFDFRQKTVAFVMNDNFIDKQKYFKNWGGNDVVNSLIVLTDDEKQRAKGYDAIIVSWRKQGVSNHFRKRLLRRLA